MKMKMSSGSREKAVMNTEAQFISLGNEVAMLLGLKLNAQGRFETSGGTKTPLGLGLTIQRLYINAKHGEASNG
jgi:hypothetical protein